MESLGRGSPECHLMTSGGVASGTEGEEKKFGLNDLQVPGRHLFGLQERI